MQLLDVYLHRASREQIDHFLKTRCFHLLANQLHQHEATTELAEACLTVVFGRPFSLSARYTPDDLLSGGDDYHNCDVDGDDEHD